MSHIRPSKLYVVHHVGSSNPMRGEVSTQTMDSWDLLDMGSWLCYVRSLPNKRITPVARLFILIRTRN
jgi:hypothetical protein